ncbi:FAD binding domain-containing protein [Cupriavidus sp.]|uniref:FAD binding domain-containing protein n=1 Tax=Cupriavidus sp. TaxID=1873897 RepID=UPI0025C427A5|nr:FAD binding domain-containing protein [Cupriavidus sp.]MCA3207923.1 FAD binding domain-containing protein [Cupriavidus sp.]
MPYLRPHTLDAALARLAERPRRVLCGATDCFAAPALVPGRHEWVDISGIDALRGIVRQGGVVRIGAATTWEAITQAAWLPVALRDAAAGVGSRQIRVQGTIGGNLCHASPVADGLPPLLSLDANVELASVRGVRHLPLHDFVLGSHRTALMADELLMAVTFPLPAASERTAFVKCTNRDGMVLAVVSAAVRLRMADDDTLAIAAISIGGASEVPLRMPALEAALAGRPRRELDATVADASLAALSPIDDCRATAVHRMDLARLALARAISHCIEESAHDDSAH